MSTPMDGSKENPVVYFDSNGNGPLHHVCSEEKSSPSRAVQAWLDRQIMLGGVSRSEAQLVERLIDDLR